MSSENHSRYDKNVSPKWKPVAALDQRPKGMPLGERLYHLLISLGGIAIAAAGVAICWLLHSGKFGGSIIAAGFGVFVYGFPSEAQRKRYRE